MYDFRVDKELQGMWNEYVVALPAVQSSCSLPYDRSITPFKPSSHKTSSPHRAVQCFIFQFTASYRFINPLNAELKPICHSLILLGDLTFMGTYIVSIFQYISNKMQRYTVYLYLKNALHVSGGTSIHHQERIQLYLQHLVFVTPLLLSAAIVKELELV